MTWAVMVCLRIRLIPPEQLAVRSRLPAFDYYNIITSAPIQARNGFGGPTSARSEASQLAGQDGIEGACRRPTLHIPEPGIFKQPAVFAQRTLFAFGAHQHVQGLKLG